MMGKIKNKMILCATCLSYSKFEFPVGEDVKGILRSLLYDFGFDEFLLAIPPDKHLTLCNICNQKLHDMIAYKERVLKSLKELKKYWCVNMPDKITTHTVAVASGSQKENVTPCNNVQLEDPIKIKSEEPDHLEISKPDAESLGHSNIFDSFIDIKEETDPNTPNQLKPAESINHSLEQLPTKSTRAATSTNEYFIQNFVYNKVAVLRNDNFNQNRVNDNAKLENITISKPDNKISNHNTGSVVLNSSAITDISGNNFMNNKIATMTVDSIKQNSVNYNEKFNQNYVPIANNIVSEPTNEFSHNFVETPINVSTVNNIVQMQSYDNIDHNFMKSYNKLNQSYVNNQTLESRNDSLIQNFERNKCFNLNIRRHNVDTDFKNLENAIQSSLLVKNASILPVVNDIVTLDNSNINHNSHTSNAVASTNLSDQNNKCIFKSVSIDNGHIVLGGENKIVKKVKIVKMDNRGNIENVGQGVMYSPRMSSSKDTNLDVPVRCESADSSKPNTDTKSESDGDRIKKNQIKIGSAVNQRKLHERPAERGQKIWYINIVSREEIIKNMEESRNYPDFLEAPYKCVSCVALFPDKSLAEEHQKLCHSEGFEFVCFACSHTFKGLNILRRHHLVHTIDKLRFRCTTCEFGTRDVEYIKSHVCPNAGSERLPPTDPKTMRVSKCGYLFYCHKCEYMTHRGSLLKTHYEIKHKNRDVPKEKCGECGKFYLNRKSLRDHMNNVHRGKKPKGDPVYCNLCNKWFSNKLSHYAHMRKLHTPKEDLKFTCDECEKGFLTAKQLENHKKIHEIIKEGVKNNKCTVCDKSYYFARSLAVHIKEKHTDRKITRDHVCEVCGEAFTQKGILRGHMARHSDARPYKCKVCGDTFKYSGALFTHTKLKHKKRTKTGENTEIAEKTTRKKRKV